MTRVTRGGHFEVTDLGTVWTITPLTDEARDWIEEHAEREEWQERGDALAVEPRAGRDLLFAALEDLGAFA